jgi:hypothetical protein
MSTERLALVEHYSYREDISYDEARVLLLEEAQCHDNPLEFLEDVGFEPDYLYDAVQLMQEAGTL